LAFTSRISASVMRVCTAEHHPYKFHHLWSADRNYGK
jgi:hypothetical protein